MGSALPRWTLPALTTLTRPIIVLLMQPLRELCPPLPELPPLFWNRVSERISYWHSFYLDKSERPPPLEEMRQVCIQSIKKRLKNIYAGKKNAGRSMFELADYYACLTVIDSRN